MSLLQAIEGLNVKALRSEIPEEYSDNQKQEVLSKIRSLVGGSKEAKTVQNEDMVRLLALVDQYEKMEDTSGFHRLFKDPYSIDSLPKHKAFFDATRLYREVMMLGGNRCGKTTNGATVVAMIATGEYEDWWTGVRYRKKTDCWAIGKTGQSTRDTVQKALMGPIGSWGTGMLPADSIIRTTARAGISGAIDTVEVRHVSGAVSTIGFKSYDQKPSSFYGTAMNVVWLDEPAPDLVYHECLVRTMQLAEDPVEGPKGGRLIYTQTPKEGLTRLTAEFLSSCELLAGAERIKGLESMIRLQEMEEAKNDENY